MVKRTNNDLQNTTQKTKDRTPLTIGGDRSCAGRVPSSCSTRGTRRSCYSSKFWCG